MSKNIITQTSSTGNDDVLDEVQLAHDLGWRIRKRKVSGRWVYTVVDERGRAVMTGVSYAVLEFLLTHTKLGTGQR